MKNLAERVIELLIKDGCVVDVVCEGEVDLEKSNSYKEVIEAINGVDCIPNIVAFKNSEYVCSFAVCLDDFDPEETVIDYTVSEYSEYIYNQCIK